MYSVLFRHIAKAKKRGDREESSEQIVDKACQQFTTTILKMIRRFKTSHMCVIFDNDGQNFRHRISPIYKANRKERPPEVFPLKQAIYERFRQEGIPYLFASDHEGDDLIGTLAARAESMARCDRVIILSGDTDLSQLITQKTHLYLINTGVFTGKWVSLRNMKEMFDVMPEQLTALKALLGDRTDNIKGVSGLRRINVLRFVERYPDLSDFLARQKGTNKTEALILRHREHVETNLLLAEIRCDMQFHLRWDDLKVSTWYKQPPKKESSVKPGKQS
jgi:DNA polymerase-1